MKIMVVFTVRVAICKTFDHRSEYPRFGLSYTHDLNCNCGDTPPTRDLCRQAPGNVMRLNFHIKLCYVVLLASVVLALMGYCEGADTRYVQIHVEGYSRDVCRKLSMLLYISTTAVLYGIDVTVVVLRGG